MPKIWGDTPFGSDEQGQWALAAVMARFNEINQFVLGERVQPPVFHFDRGSDGTPSVRGWAIGFVKAVNLRENEWEPLARHETSRAPLGPVFAYINDANGDSGATFSDIPTDEQDSYFASIMSEVIQGIHAFWEQREPSKPVQTSTPPRRRKVGRNEPCPCGSGRKAKRCCGAG